MVLNNGSKHHIWLLKPDMPITQSVFHPIIGKLKSWIWEQIWSNVYTRNHLQYAPPFNGRNDQQNVHWSTCYPGLKNLLETGNCQDAKFVFTGGTRGCNRSAMMLTLPSLTAPGFIATTTYGCLVRGPFRLVLFTVPSHEHRPDSS